MAVTKTQLFIVTFLSYVSIHSLRTTYSFSKHFLDEALHVDKSAIGFVDSILLIFLGIGHFMHAIYPVKKPVKTLQISMILCALDYALVPFLQETLHYNSYWILFGLMAFNGFLQSYTWPNLLMTIQAYFDPKKQSTLLAFWSTNSNVGNIVGYLLCYQLVQAHNFHWETGMYVAAGFTLLAGIWISLRLRQVQSPEQMEKKLQAQHIKTSHVDQKQLDQHMKISKVFKDVRVLFLTLAFSLIKSVIYGIMLWLPIYFHDIGMVQYQTWIPITYDITSIIGSLYLGYLFKTATFKGPLLGPIMLILVGLFVGLKFLSLNVLGYFLLIAGVGACLGGSFNTMAGLVTMELAKVVPKQYQNQCLGFYSALTMSVANITTAITQILIGYVANKDQQMIFMIFLVYSFGALLCFLVVAIKEIQQWDKNHAKLSKFQIAFGNWFGKHTLDAIKNQTQTKLQDRKLKAA